MRPLHRGGKVIGSGGYGDVYDSISDLGEIKRVVKYDAKNTSSNVSKEKLANLVFKDFFESRDYYEEVDNNALIHQWLSPGLIVKLTHLHPLYRSVHNVSDSFVVYRRMKNNLEDEIFKPKGDGYLRTFSYDYKLPRAILNNAINNALDLLIVIHKNNYLHRDVKLDNFLIDENNNIILADYGLLKPISEEQIDYMTHFEGMCDYMPPFCHFSGFGDDKKTRENYAIRMQSLFFNINTPSKHPTVVLLKRKSTNVQSTNNVTNSQKRLVSSQILDTYKDGDINKYKIDLHPLGIVILQLVKVTYMTQDLKNLYIEFALKLMKDNDGFNSAAVAKESFTNNLFMLE